MVRISPLFLLIGLTAELPVTASEPLPFYDQKARGWFWKERLPPSTPEVPQKDQSAPVPQQKPEASQPVPLTAAWFRNELGPIRDQALDEPTPAHVLRFFQLQRILLDKAERFSKVARSIMLQHPELDERHRPGTMKSPVSDAHGTPDQHPTKALLALGRQAGLLLVHRSDCPYCRRMAPLLEHICELSGFRLYALSLDGPALQGLSSATTIENRSLAQRLGVRATPALFLMVPGMGFHSLGEGFMTEIELEERLRTLGEALKLIPPAPEPDPMSPSLQWPGAGRQPIQAAAESPGP